MDIIRFAIENPTKVAVGVILLVMFGLLSAVELSVQLTPDGVTARNYAFDVTPARLVGGLITERGACPASEAGLLGLYPEHSA